MICESCVHEEVCSLYCNRQSVEGCSTCMIKVCNYTNSEKCPNFKDASKLIELPCNVGDYCISKDYLCRINGIGYFNDVDGNFLLHMSMVGEPCYCEDISSKVTFIPKQEFEANKDKWMKYSLAYELGELDDK